jgi:hypothetical protein
MRIACAGAALAAAAVLMVASAAGAAPSAPAGAPAANPLAATSSAQLAGDLRPLAARKVKIKTTDRRPGGLMDADVSWSGRGRSAPGSSAPSRTSSPMDIASSPTYGATGRAASSALVRVCLTSPSEGMRYCSPWS